MGKTRLLDEVAASPAASCSGAQRVRSEARPTRRSSRPCARTSAPSRMRSTTRGPLRSHLALILPELGRAVESVDRPTLYEAIRCAFAHLAAQQPVTVVLDDLQWSDEATLELLPALAEPLTELPILMLAAYRSDGLPRDHLLRRVRQDLRRAGRLEEVVLSPLGRTRPGRSSRRCSVHGRRPPWWTPSTTAPRGCPSSSRSWAVRSTVTARAGRGPRRPRAGRERPRCPFRTPCATRFWSGLGPLRGGAGGRRCRCCGG